MLEGDQIKIVDEHASSLPDCPTCSPHVGLTRRLVGRTVNVLIQLAVSMLAHGRGGALLVVPVDSHACRSSIVQPIRYAVTPPYSALVGLIRDTTAEPGPEWQATVGRAIDAIAGLTAVDGAAIITARYELLAFGAKIARRKGSSLVEQVTVTETDRGWGRRGRPSHQLGEPDTCPRRSSSTTSAARCARRVAGRALHRVRLVAVRGDGYAHRVERC